jgi:hypothetical protein
LAIQGHAWTSPVCTPSPTHSSSPIFFFTTFCETETLMMDAEHSCRHVVLLRVCLAICTRPQVRVVVHRSAWHSLVQSPCHGVREKAHKGQEEKRKACSPHLSISVPPPFACSKGRRPEWRRKHGDTTTHHVEESVPTTVIELNAIIAML